MAVILGMQGKYSEAEELCERTLSLRIQHLKASHPFCYVSKLYLAWIYNETGRFKDAEAIELEVLGFQKAFYKSDTHNDVLHTKGQLASTFAFTSRHKKAETLKREVLSSRQTLSGDDHPVTFRCKSSLGLTCMELGKFAEAQAFISDAWTRQKTALGADHPETLTTMSRAARLFDRQGRSQEAEQCYHDVVSMSIKTLGANHPRTESRLADLRTFESARWNSGFQVKFRSTVNASEIDVKALTIVDEREVDVEAD
jgi:tetratricopeptide (TPR) repeat protein